MKFMYSLLLVCCLSCTSCTNEAVILESTYMFGLNSGEVFNKGTLNEDGSMSIGNNLYNKDTIRFMMEEEVAKEDTLITKFKRKFLNYKSPEELELEANEARLEAKSNYIREVSGKYTEDKLQANRNMLKSNAKANRVNRQNKSDEIKRSTQAYREQRAFQSKNKMRRINSAPKKEKTNTVFYSY